MFTERCTAFPKYLYGGLDGAGHVYASLGRGTTTPIPAEQADGLRRLAAQCLNFGLNLGVSPIIPFTT